MTGGVLLENLTKTFKALSDPNRIRILKLLEVQPLCVCEITWILGLAASTVSKHLSILKEAGFIFDHKDNKWVNYYLNVTNRSKYVSEIMPLIKKWLSDDKIIKKDRNRMEFADRTKICIP